MNIKIVVLLFLISNLSVMNLQTETTAAERISRSSEIILNDKIDNVFPLFGPVREMDWEYGWNPEIIYSNHELVEKGMIFKSSARFEGEQFYVWIVTQYRPSEYLIEYTVSAPDRVWFIHVQCEPIGMKTKARISYTFTSLNEHGSSLNRIALDLMYSRDLKDWEEALNYYLKTGTALGSPKSSATKPN